MKIGAMSCNTHPPTLALRTAHKARPTNGAHDTTSLLPRYDHPQPALQAREMRRFPTNSRQISLTDFYRLSSNARRLHV